MSIDTIPKAESYQPRPTYSSSAETHLWLDVSCLVQNTCLHFPHSKGIILSLSHWIKQSAPPGRIFNETWLLYFKMPVFPAFIMYAPESSLRHGNKGNRTYIWQGHPTPHWDSTQAHANAMLRLWEQHSWPSPPIVLLLLHLHGHSIHIEVSSLSAQGWKRETRHPRIWFCFA